MREVSWALVDALWEQQLSLWNGLADKERTLLPGAVHVHLLLVYCANTIKATWNQISSVGSLTLCRHQPLTTAHAFE
jgi:hypothetical protein